MKCETLHNQLIFYMEGETAPDETKKIANHLQQCEKCANLYSEFQATFGIIETEKEIKVNPFLKTRINQQIANRKIKQKPLKAWNKLLQPALVTFLLLIAISSGVLLGNIYGSSANDTQFSETASNTTFYLNDFEQEPIETALLTDNQ